MSPGPISDSFHFIEFPLEVCLLIYEELALDSGFVNVPKKVGGLRPQYLFIATCPIPLLMSLLLFCRAVKDEATDVLFKNHPVDIICGAPPSEIQSSTHPGYIRIPSLWGNNFIEVLEEIRCRERIRTTAATICCHHSDKPEDFAAIWA